jgi:hypothetical protein
MAMGLGGGDGAGDGKKIRNTKKPTKTITYKTDCLKIRQLLVG